MNFIQKFSMRYRENLAHIKNKDKNAFEIIKAAGVITLIELERIRKIIDGGGSIHGWQTIQHGIWHDDPNGDLTVNGRIGFYTFENIVKDKPNLLTTSGRDFFHAQVYTNTSAGTRGGNYVAVTTDTGAAAAGSTTLASEISTGGLARADADTKSHTSSTNVSTVEHTFTATAIHTAVVKSALFNAASSGQMTHENTFTTVTLQINDTLKVTWTLTLG